MGDPKLIAMFVIGAIGRTARWYRPEGRVPEDECRRTVSQLLIHGFLVPQLPKPTDGYNGD